MKKLASKIVLGSAQFGLDYGVSNVDGKTSLSEVDKILKLARNYGVEHIDTARMYGESEFVLGQTSVAREFEIITKVPSIEKNVDVLTQLDKSISSSLNSLRVNNVYGLLAHRPSDLLGENADALYDGLRSLKTQGIVKKIGCSVYSPNEALEIIRKFDIDLIQLPFNIFDQRFLDEGVLELLKKKNIEVHARSIFLQGLLLMDELPSGFENINHIYKGFVNKCKGLNLEKLQCALGFVVAQKSIDKIVVGVNNSLQLNEILHGLDSDIDFNVFKEFKIEDEKVINPSMWKL